MIRLGPIHPGEVLKCDFMEPLELSASALANAPGITPARISESVRGRRGITAFGGTMTATCRRGRTGP